MPSDTYTFFRDGFTDEGTLLLLTLQPIRLIA